MSFPFSRVIVDYAVEGGAQVTWSLDRHFVDPLPHSYQLQAAKTSSPTADDWEDVGTSAENVFYATDGEKRLWGKSLEVHYRVVLTSPVGVYASDPASMTSAITYRDWLDVREHYRQYKKGLSKFKGTQGFLLKRRRFGVPCRTCLDELTEEGTRDNCPTCFGCEVEGGYYAPIPNFYVDLTVQQSREKTDLQARATVRDITIKGFCPGDIIVQSKDLFVEYHSDRRWHIETTATESELRGYPICLGIEIRQLPFSHVAYQIPVR